MANTVAQVSVRPAIWSASADNHDIRHYGQALRSHVPITFEAVSARIARGFAYIVFSKVTFPAEVEPSYSQRTRTFRLIVG